MTPWGPLYGSRHVGATPTFNLKVLPQVADSYKTLVINYQDTRCHNTENHNLDLLTEMSATGTDLLGML
jgi:hypothetical protein